MRPEAHNWLDAAAYDLETACHMLSAGRYLYVVFLCHLTLEKLLKACVSEVTAKPAPRTHDLLYLAKSCGVPFEGRYLEFLGRLNNASIPTRYPDDIGEAVKMYNKDVAEGYLRQTEEVVKWLRQRPELAE